MLPEWKTSHEWDKFGMSVVTHSRRVTDNGTNVMQHYEKDTDTCMVCKYGPKYWSCGHRTPMSCASCEMECLSYVDKQMRAHAGIPPAASQMIEVTALGDPEPKYINVLSPDHSFSEEDVADFKNRWREANNKPKPKPKAVTPKEKTDQEWYDHYRDEYAKSFPIDHVALTNMLSYVSATVPAECPCGYKSECAVYCGSGHETGECRKKMGTVEYERGLWTGEPRAKFKFWNPTTVAWTVAIVPWITVLFFVLFNWAT
jgi:hypothetical protein